jgi:carbamoyl-phosphate synthase small subunit
MTSAYVLLEDGTRFDGEACGAPGHAVGEVVFTTGMAGYQESMTDPSFHAQLITFTAPMVGNYGVSEEAMESDRIHARAAIMREAVNAEDAPSAERGWLDWLLDCGVVAITGVDTRALVRHIREAGAMLGGVFPGAMGEDEARALIAAEPPMTGRDLAREVTSREPHVVPGDGSGPRIVALDTGIKTSIVRNFVQRGATLELLPCTTPADEVLGRGADGIFLVPGPGDPATLGYLVETVRAAIGRMPVFGICLGHQVLSQAVGLETFKLPFGHRGGNHPVKDLRTGRIAITAQNHGFAVRGEPGKRLQTDFGEAELTHVNLYDGTIEGLRLLDVPAGCVQYHPEAGPGPHDSVGLFDEFIREIRNARPDAGPAGQVAVRRTGGGDPHAA